MTEPGDKPQKSQTQGDELSRHRLDTPPFVFWTCLWGAGLAIGLVAIIYDILAPDLGVPLGRDFSNLYTAGTLAIENRAHEAFDPNTHRLALRDIVGELTQQVYSYPPHALFVGVPFALLSYQLSLIVWTLATAAFFYWAAKPHVAFAPVLAVLTPAAVINIWAGQYGLLFGGLWLLYFRYFGPCPVRAGLIAAAMTFKPHLGLFVGLTAFTHWRTVAAAALSTMLLIFLSGAAFGWEGWYGFISQNVGTHVGFLTQRSDDFYFRLMPAAFTAYGKGMFGLSAQIAFAVAAIWLLIRSRRIDPFALATATFLIIPYGFVYDMTVVCLGFANILWLNWKHLKVWERFILTLAFLSPGINMLFAIYSPMLVPPILLAGLFVQTRWGSGVDVYSDVSPQSRFYDNSRA